MKKIYLFIISLTIFSFLIFILRSYFFWWVNNELNNYIEENYIDPQYIVSENIEKKNEELLEDEKISSSLKSAYEINFIFFPNSFSNLIKDYYETFQTFLNSDFIVKKVDNLRVEFHKEEADVRWKMKDRTIKLSWIESMEKYEMNSVWIHEFAHYIDLYFLKKSVFRDVSDYFYVISWDWVKVIKWWQEQKDFVSWYAMTNKYEDFAESFTYYILHNEDFLDKTKDSEILKLKYNFFSDYLFLDENFKNTDFSIWNIIKDYYRDITKIEFSLENFLEFLKEIN